MKKILVCVKVVPKNTDVPVDDEFNLRRQDASLRFNISDEAALEAGLRLKAEDGIVTVLTMGPQKAESFLSELLALGVDEAVLISDEKMVGADTYATAKALNAAVRKLGPYDMILCGRRALDGETGQIPGRLASSLGWACVSNVEEMGIDDAGVILHRRTEDGIEVLRCVTPLVVSVCEYSYKLRLPGIRAMRQAKKKQVKVLNASDLNLAAEECGLSGSLTRVTEMRAIFPGLRNCKKLSDCKELAMVIQAEIRGIGNE